MTDVKMTCEKCFDGRHVRCMDRKNCGCTVCAKKIKRTRPIGRPATVGTVMPSPPVRKSTPRTHKRWDGERGANRRTPEQQAHYTQKQRERRRIERGDPEWLLNHKLLVTKIGDLFTGLEERELADIKEP